MSCSLDESNTYSNTERNYGIPQNFENPNDFSSDTKYSKYDKYGSYTKNSPAPTLGHHHHHHHQPYQKQDFFDQNQFFVQNRSQTAFSTKSNNIDSFSDTNNQRHQQINRFSKFKINSPILKKFLAEILGTFLLVFIGDSGVAQSVIYGTNFLDINITWAVGLTIAIYCVGGVSGAHLNPVVTLVLMVTHKFPVKEGLIYILGQFIGAFIAAGMVYVMYLDSITAFDPQLSTTQGIFATFPTHSIKNLKNFNNLLLYVRI